MFKKYRRVFPEIKTKQAMMSLQEMLKKNIDKFFLKLKRKKKWNFDSILINSMTRDDCKRIEEERKKTEKNIKRKREWKNERMDEERKKTEQKYNKKEIIKESKKI